MAAVSLFGGGENRDATQENILLFAQNAPLPQIVARGTELSSAEAAANRQRGCFAVSGAGTSMEPVYLSGTALVVRIGGYERLQRGTPVVYVSREGVSVAHMLVKQTPSGWIATGLANDNSDGELVTADNFVGVITQAFASKVGALPKGVAGRPELTLQDDAATTIAQHGL